MEKVVNDKARWGQEREDDGTAREGGGRVELAVRTGCLPGSDIIKLCSILFV